MDLHFFTFRIMSIGDFILKFEYQLLVMKKNVIITIAAISTIALTAFSFTNNDPKISNKSENHCVKPDTSKKNLELGFSEIITEQIEQRLFFNIQGRYNGTITKSNLYGSELFKHFISGYPSEWVSNYISVEIIINKGTEKFTTYSLNDTLTLEQKALINTLDFNDNLTIKVKYNYQNAVTSEIEPREMDDISLIVVTEFEALPMYGYELLIQYLEENSFDKIPVSIQNEIDQLTIHFNVSEKGVVNSVRLHQSSGNEKVDKLIIELTNSIQNWRPAEDNKGNKVSQDFELNLRNFSHGC